MMPSLMNLVTQQRNITNFRNVIKDFVTPANILVSEEAPKVKLNEIDLKLIKNLLSETLGSF